MTKPPGKPTVRIRQNPRWGAFRTNPTILDADHVIRIEHGLEAMGNEQQGSVLELELDRSSNAFLQGAIERTHGLIKDEELRIADNRARKSKTLTLTARETQAMLPYPGIVFVGQGLDEFRNTRYPQRLQNLFLGGIILGHPNVLDHGALDEVDVLTGDREQAEPIGSTDIFDGSTINAYDALGG